MAVGWLWKNYMHKPGFFKLLCRKCTGCIIKDMEREDWQETEKKRLQLQAAKTELEALERQIRNFESVVDTRLGALLDQLSELNADTAALNEELRSIRDRRLYGEELIRYLEGAPKIIRRLDVDDPSTAGLRGSKPVNQDAGATPAVSDRQMPDIKTLYRRLARRHHPDLARTDADRALSNEQMAEINQAYQAGDMRTLLRLAGMSVPFGWEVMQAGAGKGGQTKLTDEKQLDLDLKTIRQEIARLSRLPIVKLSLDVKLARHQRRDLLGEMAYDLQRKVGRKTAERDYLRAQINVNQTDKESDG